MINDDVLIKYARSRGFKHLTWPDQVVKMKERMTYMKLGFPGLGNDHLSLIEYKDVKVGDIIIIDPNVECNNSSDAAPRMLKILGSGKARIEGIGKGRDSFDPFRKTRWRDVIDVPSGIPGNFLVYRVEVRPDLNGGPGYYYFFKSYRDFRD